MVMKRNPVLSALEETEAMPRQAMAEENMEESMEGAMAAEGPTDFQGEIDAARGDPKAEREIMVNTIQALTEEVLDMQERLKNVEDSVAEPFMDAASNRRGKKKAPIMDEELSEEV